jgi:hypothetical protein
MQLTIGNLTEAAWSLKAHADLFDWDLHQEVPAIDSNVSLQMLHAILDKRPSSNSKTSSKMRDKEVLNKALLEGLLKPTDVEMLRLSQSSFERKSLIWLIIIYLFAESACYEHALVMAESLADKFARVAFSNTRLAKMYRVMAIMVELQSAKERYYPEYFRVAFVGQGWQRGDVGVTALYGKQFVYRGKEWEKLGDFTERVLAKYPGAKLLNHNKWPVEDSISQSEECWLQICKVDPQPASDRYHEARPENQSLVPDCIWQWYQHNDTSVFIFTRPFRKHESKSSENEFINLWIEGVFLFNNCLNLS